MADVLIAGAGMAGAAAALSLSKAGHSITILEAQFRIGGRGYARGFAGEEEGTPLEFGGSWITPWHQRIRSLAAEHGLSLRPRQPVSQRYWMRQGESCPAVFLDPSERVLHEKAVARIAADALLYKSGHAEDEKGRPLLGITFRDYLDRIPMPASTRHLMSAWWSVSGSGQHDLVAASEFLSSCAYGDGLAEAMIDAWADTVVPGMSALAERMIKASGARLHFNAAVASVVQEETGIRITTRAGETFRASQAVLALGINQMKEITFSPALPAANRQAIDHGHAGRAFKLWIKARGVPLGTLATGDGKGIELLFAERQADDGTMLLIGFGLDLDDAEPGNQSWVRAELARLIPNAEYVASDWHDWVKDPFARGTWVSVPVHISKCFEPEAWKPIGRLHFASSDYAPEQAGWFEGAVIAGEAAAAAVNAIATLAVNS